MSATPAKTHVHGLAAGVVAVAVLCGCQSEGSVNESGSNRLSGASNRLNNSAAWSVDQSSIEERWDEDPTVMEPDYPLMNPMPGFANQGAAGLGP
ncbi:MAG: hypothetical protein EXS03_02705 [Phycisphaerales bacterium]|nr:hypothetical protein [Phycisphaerales bacterium]